MSYTTFPKEPLVIDADIDDITFSYRDANDQYHSGQFKPFNRTNSTVNVYLMSVDARNLLHRLKDEAKEFKARMSFRETDRFEDGDTNPDVLTTYSGYGMVDLTQAEVKKFLSHYTDPEKKYLPDISLSLLMRWNEKVEDGIIIPSFEIKCTDITYDDEIMDWRAAREEEKIKRIEREEAEAAKPKRGRPKKQ